MTRARALTGMAAALLVAGLVGVLAAGDDGGNDAPAEVLGVQETRPSTTTTEAPAPSPTTTTEAPAPAPTTATPPPPTTTTTVLVTETASTSEDAAFFTHRKNGENEAGSSTAITNEPGVHLTVTGTADDGVATIHSTVENGTGGEIRFPEGLVVTVKIKRNGQPWQTVTAEDRRVTALQPGQAIRVGTTMPLDQYGHYSLTAETTYVVS